MRDVLLGRGTKSSDEIIHRTTENLRNSTRELPVIPSRHELFVWSLRRCMEFLIKLISLTFEATIHDYLQYVVGTRKSRPALRKVLVTCVLSVECICCLCTCCTSSMHCPSPPVPLLSSPIFYCCVNVSPTQTVTLSDALSYTRCLPTSTLLSHRNWRPIVNQSR